jgi:hypothetical protein
MEPLEMICSESTNSDSWDGDDGLVSGDGCRLLKMRKGSKLLPPFPFRMEFKNTFFDMRCLDNDEIFPPANKAKWAFWAGKERPIYQQNHHHRCEQIKLIIREKLVPPWR